MAALQRNIVDLAAKLSFCHTNRVKSILSSTVPAITVPVRGKTRKKYLFHPDAFIGFKVDPREQHEREYVSHPLIYKDVDPAPRFMDCRVQSILKNLTGCDMDKVFRFRAVLNVVTTPQIVFFTDEQLEQSQKRAEVKAAELLMMPPVMLVRNQEPQVISYDPALAGLMPNFRTVFTDISLGVADHNRIIVVRDNTGTLRHASISERRRMNQIYNRKQYRKIFISELFTAKFLPNILEREEYEFVLDRACEQFEPDDPAYQSTVAHVYEAVDEKQLYDKLLSTRYYGPMLFFFVWHKKIDNYLAYHLRNGRLDTAGEAVRLYCLVHQKSDVALSSSPDLDNAITLVE
ncbi:Ribosomal protein S22 mitochondrial, partial [Trinorchestia longiramus]